MICINLVASITLLALIRFMNMRGTLNMNLYVSMVTLMTITCFFWDSTFIFEFYVKDEAVGKLYQSICSLFGTSTAVWNFFIVAMVYWTTITDNKEHHAANMRNGIYLKWLCACNFIVSISVAVYMPLQELEAAWSAYDIWRLFIASCSLVVLALLVVKLYQTTTPDNRANSPLFHLLRKLALYPIGNIISRLGSLPYDMVYGLNLQDFPNQALPSQKFVLFLFIILTPSCGIIDLVIFCRMQNGTKALKEMLGICPSIDVGEVHIDHIARSSSIVSTEGRTRDGMASNNTNPPEGVITNTPTVGLSKTETGADMAPRASNMIGSVEDEDYAYGEGAMDMYQRMSLMDEDALYNQLRLSTVNPSASNANRSSTIEMHTRNLQLNGETNNPIILRTAF